MEETLQSQYRVRRVACVNSSTFVVIICEPHLFGKCETGAALCDEREAGEGRDEEKVLKAVDHVKEPQNGGNDAHSRAVARRHEQLVVLIQGAGQGAVVGEDAAGGPLALCGNVLLVRGRVLRRLLGLLAACRVGDIRTCAQEATLARKDGHDNLRLLLDPLQRRHNGLDVGRPHRIEIARRAQRDLRHQPSIGRFAGRRKRQPHRLRRGVDRRGPRRRVGKRCHGRVGVEGDGARASRTVLTLSFCCKR